MLNGPEVKVIYSKRYPLDEINDIKADKESGCVLTASEKTHNMRWNEFVAKWDHMIENSVYIPLLWKIKYLKTFINLAIRLSSKYEIGLDIKDHLYYTSATFYCFCGIYDGPFMTTLATLMDMSDKFISRLPGDKSCDFIISLDYFTHDHYAEGKKLNF